MARTLGIKITFAQNKTKPKGLPEAFKIGRKIYW